MAKLQVIIFLIYRLGTEAHRSLSSYLLGVNTVFTDLCGLFEQIYSILSELRRNCLKESGIKFGKLLFLVWCLTHNCGNRISVWFIG